MDREIMRDMMKEMLKDGLSVRLETKSDYEGYGFNVIVEFEGEKVADDYFILERDDDY